MEGDGRLSCTCAPNLNFSPAHAPDTKTQDFRDGFLRSPPTGEMKDVRAAIHLFPLRVDAVQESAGVPLQHIPNPYRFNDVDPNLRAHARSSAARRVLSPVRGRALAAPFPAFCVVRSALSA